MRQTLPPPVTLDVARRRLRELGNPEDAKFLQRFFKTAPGQYGAGDRFLGIRVPATRALGEELRALPIDDVAELLRDEWHEARLLALILLVHRFETGSPAERSAVYMLYLRNTAFINNWDLVDASAANIVGAHLMTRSRTKLDRLARSRSIWERRIAIIATFWFIRQNEFADTLRVAEQLLGDREDLIHKAVGWMLREVGKRDPRTLEGFLAVHAGAMPRTALRYAIERMSAVDRKRWMNA